MKSWRGASSDSIIEWNPHILKKVSMATSKFSRKHIVPRVVKPWRKIKHWPRKKWEQRKARKLAERAAIAERKANYPRLQGVYDTPLAVTKAEHNLQLRGYRTQVIQYKDEAGQDKYKVLSIGEPARLTKGAKREIKEQAVQVKTQIEEPVKREMELKNRQAFLKWQQEAEKRSQQLKAERAVKAQAEALALQAQKKSKEGLEAQKRADFQVKLEEYQKRLAAVTKRQEELQAQRAIAKKVEQEMKVSAPEPVNVGGGGETRGDRLTGKVKVRGHHSSITGFKGSRVKGARRLKRNQKVRKGRKCTAKNGLGK